jgi:hypothetical protein
VTKTMKSFYDAINIVLKEYKNLKRQGKNE